MYRGGNLADCIQPKGGVILSRACRRDIFFSVQLLNLRLSFERSRRGGGGGSRRLGTTDDFTNSSLHFSLFSTALQGLGELQVCPFLDVVFSPLPSSALSSSSCHCALQDGFGQARYTEDERPRS